ncbi:MAG: MATE family efflux transporter, partial [Bullifex sp.]|nr:MATE family efflux transporter [Spirochaetales bacterium]MDY5776984.1 MATE family efflux transporter [Bullifex sp.]
MTREELMAKAPVGRLILRLAIPTICAQLINALYSIVDRIYLGHIPGTGGIVLTGVGVTFPILMLITAFSNLIGAGGAPLASIQLGSGNKEKAEDILNQGACSLIMISIVLTVLFSVFKTPLLFLFGASSQTIGYAEDYIGIYLLGTVFVQLALGLNP